MPTPTTGMVWIRDYLRRQGVPDAAIGWNDGTVTLYGQSYFKPTVVQEGRSYARPSDLPSIRSFVPAVQRALTDVQRTMRQAPITEQDIVNSPTYQAWQKVIEFNRQQRQADLRRDLASRGLLRSTPAVQALSAEDVRSEAALASAIPQVIQTINSLEQQRVENALSLLGSLIQQQAVEAPYVNAPFSSYLQLLTELIRQFGGDPSLRDLMMRMLGAGGQ